MTDSSKPPAPKATGKSKSVMIQGDGSSYNVMGEGENRQHADIESALKHARSIFGGKSGSDDVAEEAGGEGASLQVR